MTDFTCANYCAIWVSRIRRLASCPIIWTKTPENAGSRKNFRAFCGKPSNDGLSNLFVNTLALIRMIRTKYTQAQTAAHTSRSMAAKPGDRSTMACLAQWWYIQSQLIRMATSTRLRRMASSIWRANKTNSFTFIL